MKKICIALGLFMLSANIHSEVYYFAYGSNLNQTQMNQRIGENEFIDTAYLPNYIFKFNKQAKMPDQGFANIEPQDNSLVYGAVYKLSEGQLIMMDKMEGYYSEGNPDNHYDRQELEVVLINKKEVLKVIAYVAGRKYRAIEKNLMPSELYLTTVLNGASEKQLPQEYIDSIQAKAMDPSQL